MIKHTIRLFAALLLSLGLATTASAETTRVLMKTSLGDIELELDAAKAPKSVENFLRYVDKGFYNDTVFHRVINKIGRAHV